MVTDRLYSIPIGDFLQDTDESVRAVYREVRDNPLMPRETSPGPSMRDLRGPRALRLDPRGTSNLRAGTRQPSGANGSTGLRWIVGMPRACKSRISASTVATASSVFSTSRVVST